ncbi:putative mucin TcMUCII [Trypanosoma cruzi]|uniref:Mucin TcMUCII, putative n=2 Tax=Trypanosoma cruzi TaxID=5693 RepID=Q4DVI4_TRYCC|nr:mucin TcMUCII, putative [Trypanosoma cruzi]EAN96527.1 mucin TcMUCII, putative [Trypanosoma cruzi]PWV11842.1 putative mucin TcMUCII [Trypanosoma cruzi]RNC58858.1 mucin TcMUCII [Trypanosoma cruzi]|eukprot:XP_818378.1 mucin TcMUCII [Trypanosoma cruzi strain CL Brener]
MTTCRLLCALLVLALCCCPSVCAGDTQEATEGQADIKDPNLSSVSPESMAAAPNVGITGPAAPASEDKLGKGNSEFPGLGSSAESGKSAVEGGSTVTEPQSNKAPNTIQTEVNNGTTGPGSGTSSSADQTDNNAKDVPARTTTKTKPPTTTTTTTTKAPTTTSTTTTHAPSTTTTEAPAVSTTRAPSRLREIDGSLSSSAWVCAPLLLAASTLAYTTLG